MLVHFLEIALVVRFNLWLADLSVWDWELYKTYAGYVPELAHGLFLPVQDKDEFVPFPWRAELRVGKHSAECSVWYTCSPVKLTCDFVVAAIQAFCRIHIRQNSHSAEFTYIRHGGVKRKALQLLASRSQTTTVEDGHASMFSKW